MIKLLQMLVTCLFLSIQLNAQVEPPIIRCITNDTLFYSPVSNSCGPFIAYEIFSSPSPTGPFTSLDNVTDETIDFYIDFNSSSQVQYYFIRPRYNCPGAQIINSDTVTNRPPRIPILQTVSVVNGEVELSWDRSVSPESTSTSIFLVTDTGLDLLGESTTTTFIDNINDPNQMSLTYLIAANDDCNIQSAFGDPISSAFLTNAIDPCVGEVVFEWNRHLNVVRQELWMVDGNGQNVMVASLPADAEEFTSVILPNDTVEGYFIRGYTDEQAGEFADSNISLRNTNVINFIDEIFFTEVQTLDDNNIAIAWCWDQTAAVNNYDILQDGPSGSNIISQNILGSTPAAVNENIGVSNTAEDVYSLQVSSTDICDRVFDSQQIRSIVLEVEPVAQSTIDIEWSRYEYSEATLINYQLHEVIDGVDNIIFEGSQNRFTQTGTTDGEETCFYVEAIAEGFLLDGSSKSTLITSNTACTNGFPVFRIPNAFNPYGINSIFRPVFANIDVISTYELNVFSRYGEQLFSTNVLEDGWNGRSGLKEMPQGVYSYLVEIEMTNGQSLIRRGSVLLVR